MLSVNVFAEDTQVLTYKAHVENNQITVTEDELISDVDNSDLNVRVVKRSGETETLMYTGPLGGYENGVYSFCDFNEIQFIVIFDWDTMENEAIYIIPIDDNNRNSIDNNVSQKLETGKSLIRQSNLITTAIDDAEINISLLYNNSYSECVLLPGEELTAEINVKNNDAINDIPLSTIIALYDNNGKLLSINTESVTVNADGNDTLINNIVVPVDDTVSTAKIMIWESVNSLKPYAEPVILTLNGNDFFGDDYDISQHINGKNKANGKINESNDIDVFSFVPQKDGLYYFETFSEIDTYASLYVESDLVNAIAVDDNSGKDNNFRLSATLNANTTYYLYLHGRDEGQYTLNYGYSIGNVFGTVNPVKFYDDDTEFNSIAESTVDLRAYYSGEFVATMHLKDWSDSDSEYASYSLTGLHPGEYIVATKRPGYLTYYKKISLSDNVVDLGSVTLIPGDVNGDDIVNANDVDLITDLLGIEYGDDNYLISADINGDKVINENDLGLVNLNLNKTSNEYGGTANVIIAETEIEDSSLIISGFALPESVISCDIFYNGYSVYEAETTCTLNGSFEFVADLNRNGDYTVTVSGVNQAYEITEMIEY